MKRIGILLTVLVMIMTCTAAGAEELPLERLFTAGKTLLLNTHNVTIEGTAEFSLDHQAAFKKAEASYIQDGTSSIWRLKLLTPRNGGERVTGFTVVANDELLYLMEDYTPGVYWEGSDQPQDTVLRNSAYLSQILDLTGLLLPQIAEQLGDSVREQADASGKTVEISISADQVPDAMNRLMNLGGQFLIRRLFGVDYDYDTYAGTRMEQYVTVTQGILGCTESFTLQNLELRVETDTEERISAVEGRLEVELSTYNDGKHTLEVTLNGHAGAYGQSYVGAFSPEAYGVRTEYELASLAAESMPEALSEPFVPEAKGSVVYSERYERIHLAEKTLEKVYGLTPDMYTFFSRSVTEDANGALSLKLTGMNHYEIPLGTYTVTVDSDGAKAVWSHDGKDVGNGFESDVWGLEQLKEMLKITKEIHEVLSFYDDAERIAEAAHPGYVMPTEELMDYAMDIPTPEELEAGRRLSWEELEKIGKQAVYEMFELSEEQAAQLESMNDADEPSYEKKDGMLVYQAWEYLTQREYPEWVNGDGIYEVLIDASTGIVVDIIYDSGLNGNG